MRLCKFCGDRELTPDQQKYCSKLCSNRANGLKRIKWANCKQCGRKFRPKPKLKRKKTRFCSSKCYGKSISKNRNSRSNGRWVECNNCGKKVYKTVYRLRTCKKHFCSVNCRAKYMRGKNHPMTGYKHTKKDKRKISIASFKNARYGPDNYMFCGGVSIINEKIRKSVKYREWREVVYKRDNWTCQICNKRGGELIADHIKAFSKIIEENEIKTLKQAYVCEELWDISNGRTLCKECHEETDNYGSKAIRRGGEQNE